MKKNDFSPKLRIQAFRQLLLSSSIIGSPFLFGEEIARWDFQISGDTVDLESSHAAISASDVTMAGGVTHTRDSDSSAWRTRGYVGGEGYIQFSLTAGVTSEVTLESLLFGAFARAANTSGGEWLEPQIDLEYDTDPAFSAPVNAGTLDLGDDLEEGFNRTGLFQVADENTFFGEDLVISPLQTYYFRLRASNATGTTSSRNQLYYDDFLDADLILNGSVTSLTPELLWTGSESANWNLTEQNFAISGTALLFQTGDDVAIPTSDDILIDEAGVTAGDVYIITDDSSATFGIIGGNLATTKLIKTGASDFEIKNAVDTGSGTTHVADGSLQVDGGSLTTSGIILSGGGEFRLEAGGTVTNSSDTLQLVGSQGGIFRTNSGITASIGEVTTEIAGAKLAKNGSGELTVTGDFGSESHPIHLDYNGGGLIFDGPHTVSLTDGPDFSSCHNQLVFRASQVHFSGLGLGRNSETLSDDRGGSVLIEGEDTLISAVQDAGENIIYVEVVLASDLEVSVPDGDNDFHFDFPITGAGSFEKTGAGSAFFDGATSYTGETIVSGGSLVVAEAGFDDAATVSIADGASLVLNFIDDAATTEDDEGVDSVGSLMLAGVAAEAGLWGAEGSAAPNTTPLIKGPGMLLVLGGTSPTPDYDVWSTSFALTGGPADDDDGDGADNETEYAFGTDPTKAGSVSPYPSLAELSSGTLSYTRRASDLTGLDFQYTYATSLEDGFVPFTPDAVLSDMGSPIETVTITLPEALSAEPTLFLQIIAD
ncbi:MAG: autotransporter-associated beta strand repeat-containing protein [Verrucomicrobiota bacterium JB023]|nr:autotransporter-associated beta strand repeat-containing protein [Verrucomicrobiota bacterium JB023]